MAKISEGKGNYGVKVKYKDGGETVFYFETKSQRDSAYKRISKEVTKDEKVSKKNK